MALIDVDPQLAFLAFTSTIEALAQQYRVELSDTKVIGAERLQAISDISDMDERERLVRDLRNAGRATHFFVKTVTDFVDDCFFIVGHGPAVCNFSRENLESIAKNIYTARSNCLHRGNPILLEREPVDGEELPFGERIARGADTTAKKGSPFDPEKSKTRIPHLIAYERLVNHVLKQFIERPPSQRLAK